MSKTSENFEHIRQQVADGRESVFKSELPHPSAAKQTEGILHIKGNICYISSWLLPKEKRV